MTQLPSVQHAIQIVGVDEIVHNTSKAVDPVGPHQMMLEVESCGICFSDTKLLHAFDSHPRKTDVIAGISPEALAEALRAEVRRIADEGISAAELARVKTQAIATQVYKRDSLMGQAMEIGYLESAGLSWRDEQRLLEGLRAVTAEEVQAVAKRHFDDTSLNTARLDPQPLAAKRPRSPFAAPRH